MSYTRAYISRCKRIRKPTAPPAFIPTSLTTSYLANKLYFGYMSSDLIVCVFTLTVSFAASSSSMRNPSARLKAPCSCQKVVDLMRELEA